VDALPENDEEFCPDAAALAEKIPKHDYSLVEHERQILQLKLQYRILVRFLFC
jgi:hypothetical protein